MRRTFSQMRRKLVSAGQRLEERSGPVIWIETFPGPKEIALIDEILASNAEELRDLTRDPDRQYPSTGRKR
jgi:hypothetical protein